MKPREAGLMRERDVFIDALEIDDSVERSAYLQAACAGDVALLDRVRQLFTEHQRPESFLLDVSPPGLAPTVTERPMIEVPGAVIGPYKLLEEIGEGAFGVVFMAEQFVPVRRKVAVKILKPGM